MYCYINLFKKVKIPVILLLFLFLFWGSISGQAVAMELPKQYLSVSPIITDISLIPGKPFSYQLEIVNRANQPMGIHIDVSPFDPDNIADPIQTSQSLASWVSLSETNMIIPEKSGKKILVTVTPPSSSKNGGYYGTLVLTPFINQQQSINSPIVITRFLAVIFGTVGQINYDNLAKKVVITHLAPKGYLMDSKNLSMLFAVKNNYFTHFTAKPFLTIKPLLGDPVTVMPEEKHIFPGRDRSWEIETQNFVSLRSFPTNRVFYSADLAVSVGNGKQVLAHTFFILIPKYWFVIGGGIPLLLFIFLLRSRLIKAVRVLFMDK